MIERYVISQFARRMQEKIPDKPTIDFVWNKKFHQNYSANEFRNAVCKYRELIYNILTDLRANPESWHMTLNPIVEFEITGRRTNIECETSKELLQIGTVLYAFSLHGELHETTLTVNYLAFSAYNIPNADSLIKKFGTFGLVITNYSAKKSEFSVAYPKYPSLMQIIKAYSFITAPNNLKINVLMIRAEWRYFGTKNISILYYSLSDMLRGLNPLNTAIVKSTYKLACHYNYECTISESNSYIMNVRYTPKEHLLLMKRSRDTLICRFYLEHINEYIHMIDDAPEGVKKLLLSYYSCSYCITRDCSGIPFDYNGTHYEKCVLCNLDFGYITEKDVPYLMKLLEAEIKERIKTRTADYINKITFTDG